VITSIAKRVNKTPGRDEVTGVASKRRVAQLSSIQKTTKDTKHFVPEGLDERSDSTELAESPGSLLPGNS
jgi:hypothetical protein